MDNPFAVLSRIATVLNEQRIAYVLVGSLASSLHGMYRSTADIDIVADVKSDQVIPLLAALQEDFYVDELAVREAIDRKQSFYAIHSTRFSRSTSLSPSQMNSRRNKSSEVS